MASKTPGVEGQDGFYQPGLFFSWIAVQTSRKLSEVRNYTRSVVEDARIGADSVRGHVVIGMHACESTPQAVNIGQLKASAGAMARIIGVNYVWAEESYQSLPLLGRGVTFSNAKLAADMLEMYLKQTYDQAVVDRIAAAVKESKTFAALAEFVMAQVNGNVDASRPPDNLKLKGLVQNALNLARKPLENGGMNFYFYGEGLQPVIGGVTGLGVSLCRIDTPPASIPTAKEIKYSCQIVIEDTYDFDNDRTAKDPKTGKRRPTQYSIFRDHLADLILQGKFCEFESEYNQAVDKAPLRGGDWNHMNKGHVFASYMYALEKAGFYHGIPWRIEVPMTGSFRGPLGPARPASVDRGF